MFLTNTFSKNNKKICKSLKRLAAQTGVEPVTCPLGGTLLTLLGVPPKQKSNINNRLSLSRDAPFDSTYTTNPSYLTENNCLK